MRQTRRIVGVISKWFFYFKILATDMVEKHHAKNLSNHEVFKNLEMTPLMSLYKWKPHTQNVQQVS